MKRFRDFMLIGIVLVVITSCASTKPDVDSASIKIKNPEDTANTITYSEITYSELESVIVKSKEDSYWKGVIVNAYVQRGSEYYNYQDSLKLSEKPSANQILLQTAHDTKGNFKFTNLQADKMLDVDKNKFDPNKLCRVYIAIYNGDSYITKVDGMITDSEIAQNNQEKSNAKKEALEKLQNPNNLNRTEYKHMDAEKFSFNMISENIPVGSKILFIDNFITKPTDNSYKFSKIDLFIRLKSSHDFVSDIPEQYFTGFWLDNYVPIMTTVKVYVTVIKVGKNGECSIDIIEW